MELLDRLAEEIYKLQYNEYNRGARLEDAVLYLNTRTYHYLRKYLCSLSNYYNQFNNDKITFAGVELGIVCNRYMYDGQMVVLKKFCINRRYGLQYEEKLYGGFDNDIDTIIYSFNYFIPKLIHNDSQGKVMDILFKLIAKDIDFRVFEDNDGYHVSTNDNQVYKHIFIDGIDDESLDLACKQFYLEFNYRLDKYINNLK